MATPDGKKRVRVDKNTPAEVNKDITFWFAADRIVGIANGAALRRWPDLSGNGRDLFQLTTVNQPLYVTNGHNGLPIVRFDGVASPNCDFMNITPFTYNRPNQIYIAFKSLTTGLTPAIRDYIFDGDIVNSMRFGTDDSTSANGRSFITSTTNTLAFSGEQVGFPGLVSTFVIAKLTWDGASSSIVRNGTTLVSGTMDTSSPGGFVLGASPFGAQGQNIEVGEVIGYNRVLSTSEDTAIKTYLGNKWGVVVV